MLTDSDNSLLDELIDWPSPWPTDCPEAWEALHAAGHVNLVPLIGGCYVYLLPAGRVAAARRAGL